MLGWDWIWDWKGILYRSMGIIVEVEVDYSIEGNISIRSGFLSRVLHYPHELLFVKTHI